MADTLTIRELKVQCRLGIYDWEQERPQPVTLDLELAIDAAKAARQDDVKDAVDYAALVSRVKEIAAAHPYRLMETLAETVAQDVLAHFGVPEVRVRVTKKALPEISAATVEIARTRSRATADSGTRRRTVRSPKVALR